MVPKGVPEAVLSFVAESGYDAWLVGAAAHATLGHDAHSGVIEALSSAGTAACAEMEAALRERTPEGPTVWIEPLDGRTLEEALHGRGLTIEAVALGAGGRVVDPHGGVEHLRAESLRTVDPPDRALRDDPELLIRLGAAIAWSGLVPTGDLRRFAQRDSGNVLDVADRARGWGRTMNRLLLGRHIEPALQWLHATRILAYVLPEIAAMVGFDKSCAVHHKDIWEHTKVVTQKAAPDLVVRWAALCHDIGKVWTRSVNKTGKVHFFRHEEHGALLFEGIAHRFQLDSELAERVAYLIKNHSRVNLYRHDWTDSAVRRLIRQTDGHLRDLLTFSKADYTTRREARIRQMQQTMADLEARIARIREEDAREPLLNAGLGNAIMTRFGLAPSRVIGDLKRLVEAAIESGDLPERDSDETYLAWLVADPKAVEAIEGAGGSL